MEKTMNKKIPYSVYLEPEYYDKIKELAKQRQASNMVRDAICMIMDGKDVYKSGYNKGIKDSIKVIDKCKDIEHIAVKGKYLNDVLADQLKELEK
jgi:hypothetical protein